MDLAPGKCNHLLFEVRNEQYSSGIAVAITTDHGVYIGVGKGSPEPASKHVHTVQAYAKWTIGSCEGFEKEEQGPHTEAVYVKSLEHTNEAFNQLSSQYGAHPLGVQDGFVYNQGLQCILLKLPFCYSR